MPMIEQHLYSKIKSKLDIAPRTITIHPFLSTSPYETRKTYFDATDRDSRRAGRRCGTGNGDDNADDEHGVNEVVEGTEGTDVV